MTLRRVFVPLLIGGLAVVACEEPPTTGKLVVNVTGLPTDAQAAVRITGPANFLRLVNASATIEDLEPGDYIVRSDTILHSNTKYGVIVVRDTITVQKGVTHTANIPYNISSGSLNLTVTGMPPGIPADITITSGNFTTNVAMSGVVPGLAPGKYYIQSDTMVSIEGDRFGASKILDSVTIVASTTPATASVSYTLVSATLSLTVNGLPASAVGQPVTVSGPNNYESKWNASRSIRGLKPGSYTVSAVTANGTCPAIFRTSAASQTLDIAMGASGAVTVNYMEGTANDAELNLRIQGATVIQVTQDALGSVPMIAGKAAFLRVFGVANQCNTAKPKVRVTIGSATPVIIDAPEGAVRYATEEGGLSTTWNYLVPANLVAQGMTLVAEIDFDGAVSETNESDNRFPASGTRAVPIKSVPTVGVRLVPITQVTGGVSVTGNVQPDAFMDLSRRIHPVRTFDVDVREPYTSSTGTLGVNGANWNQMLNEIESLRKADTSKRYYYGVARVNYTSGVAGIGFLDAKAALGWDHLPSGSEVLAHEIGHNFNRFHSPSSACGQVPAGIDQSYPTTGLYAGGKIGVYGYDLISNVLKNPESFSDIMGYCNNKWISDYTYVGILNYLADPNREPSASVASAGTVQPSLLVWGRIVDGVPVLEPAFEIDAYASMPAAAGPNRITGVDESGAELFSFSFAANRIADLPGDNESFSFVIPRSALRGRTLASLRLSARGRTALNVASTAVDADPGVVATRPGSGRVRLRWDAARFPVLMVRNRATGNVLSFARGGDATITANQDELEISASNRVGSTRRTVRVLR